MIFSYCGRRGARTVHNGVMPRVNPDILVWARETAGLAPEEAARRLSISQERLEAMEGGNSPPTRRQLLTIAEKYRRPLIAFYLQKPPVERAIGQDFRTLPDREVTSEALISALLRDVQARQQIVRSALEESDEAKRLDFVGTSRTRDGAERLVRLIETKLGSPLREFRAQKTIGDAFAFLRERVEQTGVFVLLMGNLGSHHTNIDAKVFRGFALSDDFAPFIIINEKDSRAAWSFTLLHELAHIWLGQTGISGYESSVEIERFCDEVASRVLLNRDELRQLRISEAVSVADAAKLISEFSNARKISRKMVAYNLLRGGIIEAALYRSLSDHFDSERAARKTETDDDSEGGPNYYVVKRHRMGPTLIDFTRRMVKSGVLSTTKASKVLGVRPTSVGRLVGLGEPT